jgi:hypothetical protein
METTTNSWLARLVVIAAGAGKRPLMVNHRVTIGAIGSNAIPIHD